MKELSGKTPFREPLIPFSDDEDEHLYSFSRNRGYVIRNGSLEKRKGYPPLHQIDISIALFEKLEKDYGISVVPFSVIVGLDESNQILAFTIADKIEGKNLDEADVEESEGRKFFSGLLDYHTDVFENGGFFLYDLNENDFLYGHTNKDPKDKIYFADLDPYYELITSFNPQIRKRNFIESLETLSYILYSLESSGSDYGGLRKDLINFLKRIRSSFHPADQTTIDQILSRSQKLAAEETEEGLSETHFEKFQNEREPR